MIITTLSDITGKYEEEEENRSSLQGRAERAAADSESADGDKGKGTAFGENRWQCLLFHAKGKLLVEPVCCRFIMKSYAASPTETSQSS